MELVIDLLETIKGESEDILKFFNPEDKQSKKLIEQINIALKKLKDGK